MTDVHNLLEMLDMYILNDIVHILYTQYHWYTLVQLSKTNRRLHNLIQPVINQLKLVGAKRPPIKNNSTTSKQLINLCKYQQPIAIDHILYMSTSESENNYNLLLTWNFSLACKMLINHPELLLLYNISYEHVCPLVHICLHDSTSHLKELLYYHQSPNILVKTSKIIHDSTIPEQDYASVLDIVSIVGYKSMYMKNPQINDNILLLKQSGAVHTSEWLYKRQYHISDKTI